MILCCSVIEKRSNSKRKRWVLSIQEARQVGLQCLELIATLHINGFVHCDVKPANFVCGRGSGLSDIRMIDFGLARAYRTESDTHVDYWQHLTHFAGSLRYASIHAHLGRQLTRRDDLESLAYMMLYLMLGALPWQGFRGKDKGRLICLAKGSISLENLCRNVPRGLFHFLSYVRQLKFDQEPNYAYLRDCLNFGQVDFSEMPAGEDNGQEDPADDLPKVGRKRGAPSSTNLNDDMPELKRLRVILPAARKIHQWIVISSQKDEKYPQRMLSATSLGALIHKVNSMAAVDIGSNGMPWRVQSMFYAEDTYRAVMNCDNHGISEQKLFLSGSDAEFLDIVVEYSANGYCITHVMGTPRGWVVCGSKFDHVPYDNQRFGVSETFPASWVEECWEEGYFITAMGSTDRKWCLVASRGSGIDYEDQVVELSFNYPSESIRARWRQGYAISDAACTEEQSAYVLSRSSEEYEIIQRCTRTSHNPALKLKVESRQNFAIDNLAFGRVE